MRNWLLKSLTIVAALFMLVGGSFMSTAGAGAKIALVLDVCTLSSDRSREQNQKTVTYLTRAKIFSETRISPLPSTRDLPRIDIEFLSTSECCNLVRTFDS